MTATFIVCRLCPAVMKFMAGMGLPPEAIEESSWNAPVLDQDARVFKNRKDAEAYCKEKNRELKEGTYDEQGHHLIDIAPYTDFKILTLEAGKKVSVKSLNRRKL